MNKLKRRPYLLILFILGAGMACQLTSPTPASWSGTPTAIARAATNAAVRLTQQAGMSEENIYTPTASPTQERSTPTPQETIEASGPWLVYTAPSGAALHAYDVHAGTTLKLNLPEPIYSSDLTRGLSPQGESLFVRAGSPLNVDELALYQIALPSTEVVKRTPLMSLSLQRKIVNQEGDRAFETLEAITQSDGLAWSPDGRYLAFTAALDNESSDLYVFDTRNDRIDRLNGLYTQNASPFWSPDSNILISQELGNYDQESGWRSENVTGIRVPGYDDQNTLYLPDLSSKGEVFLGWINANTFISFSQTTQGPDTLKQMNIPSLTAKSIFDGFFGDAAFDPVTGALAFTLSDEDAARQGLVGGIYLSNPEESSYRLLRTGNYQRVFWDTGGRFMAESTQGLYTFTPQGEGMFLPDEGDARLSPDGGWMIAWGDGKESAVGARLYQAANSHPLQTLSEVKVENVLWQPDSKAFFMQSEDGLYNLAFPSLRLIEIEIGFPQDEPLELVWIE